MINKFTHFFPCMSQLSPPLRHWLRRSRTTEILKRSEFITFLRTWPTFLKITRGTKPPLFNGDVRTIDTGVLRCIINYISSQPHEAFYFRHYCQSRLFQRNKWSINKNDPDGLQRWHPSSV